MPDTYGAYEAPSARAVQHLVPAVATAGNDLNSDVYRSDGDQVVDTVAYVPAAAMTGSATARQFNLVNLGNAGIGTTVVASLLMAAGVNGVAHVPKVITLSATPANLVLAPGDVLQWQSVHVGTGIADPGGLLALTLGRT